MPSPRETLNIENVVVSTGIGQELDLDQLEADLVGVDCEPDISPGLINRTQNPKGAVLVFRSGKMVCTGAESVRGAHQALHIVFDELQSLGIDVRNDPDIVVQNMVVSGELGHPLNLIAIAIALGLDDVEYEPEQFPELVYRLHDENVVVLLFGSGRLVITGCTSFEDAERAIQAVQTRLRNRELLE